MKIPRADAHRASGVTAWSSGLRGEGAAPAVTASALGHLSEAWQVRGGSGHVSDPTVGAEVAVPATAAAPLHLRGQRTSASATTRGGTRG